MKYLMLLLAASTSLAVAHTITYDNGDVYTVADDEYVFVSKQPNLYSYHPYAKSVQFKKQWPTDKVDRPEPTPNPNPMGSHEWCKAHVPFELGYTFADQAWQRACDKNNDGEYGCGDETFDASEDAGSCPAG